MSKTSTSFTECMDLVAKVETDELDELKETINGKIRKLNNVRSTQTMLSME